MELTEFLGLFVEEDASDGFASVGSAPIFKVNGELLAYGEQILTAEDISALIQASMPAHQFEHYVSTNDANYAIATPVLGASAQVPTFSESSLHWLSAEFTMIFQPSSS